MTMSRNAAMAPSLPCLTQDERPALSARNAEVARFIAYVFRSLRSRLRLWNLRLHERAFLADVPAHQLGDMRLTAEQRDREASKPFWQA